MVSKKEGEERDFNAGNTPKEGLSEIYEWLVQSEKRKKILIDFNQPLTATQIAKRTDIPLNTCLHILWGMVMYETLFAVNADTRYSKLYWLTESGKVFQSELRASSGKGEIAHNYPAINWDIYSSVCYSHRSTVIKTLEGPMQAAAIKRRAFLKDPGIRMSANNVRDVLRYLLKHGIVRRVRIKRKRHPRYELTNIGKVFRELLVGVKVF